MINQLRTAEAARGSSRRRWGTSIVVVTLLASSMALVATPRPAAAQEALDTSNVDSILGSAGTTVWREAVQGVINPDDYVCGPSAIGAWIGDLLSESDPASLDVLFGTAATDWPIVYKLFFDNDDTDEFIGSDGAYTREHLKRQRDLLKFWDVPLDDVGLPRWRLTSTRTSPLPHRCLDSPGYQRKRTSCSYAPSPIVYPVLQYSFCLR